MKLTKNQTSKRKLRSPVSAAVRNQPPARYPTAAISRPSGIMPSVAAARLPRSSVNPEAAAATADASSVITPMNTVAEPSAAKRASRTPRRRCGVASSSSSLPSCSSADQPLTWVTAKAIRKSGSRTNIALRKPALRLASPPPMCLMRFMTVGELAKSVDSLASICWTAKIIQPAKPAMPSVHQTAGMAIIPRLRA